MTADEFLDSPDTAVAAPLDADSFLDSPIKADDFLASPADVGFVPDAPSEDVGFVPDEPSIRVTTGFKSPVVNLTPTADLGFAPDKPEIKIPHRNPYLVSTIAGAEQLRNAGSPGSGTALAGQVKQGIKDVATWATTTPEFIKEAVAPFEQTPEEQLLANSRQFALADKVSPPSAQDEFSATMPYSNADKILAGGYEAVGDTAKFFTTPLGVATLGIGALPKLAQKTIAAVFAAQMASQTPELARQLGDEMGKPEDQRDLKKISKLVTSAAINTGFTVAGAYHALPEKFKSSIGETSPTAKESGQTENAQSPNLGFVPDENSQTPPPSSQATVADLAKLESIIKGNQLAPKIETPSESHPPEPREEILASQPDAETATPSAPVASLTERADGVKNPQDESAVNPTAVSSPPSEDASNPATAAAYLRRIGEIRAGDSESADEIDRQASQLNDWAQSADAALPKQNFGQKLSQGAEHEVFVSPSGDRIIKRTYPGTFGVTPDVKGNQAAATPETYLNRLDLMNRVFGSDIRIEGVQMGESPIIGKSGEQPAIVTSQPLVRPADVDNPHPSEKEISDFMQQEGFQPTPQSYYGWERPSDGVTVIDARPDNFIKTEKGVVPVDLVMNQKKPESGIVAGSELEKWADGIISEGRKRLNVGLDPQLLSAYAIKGAAMIERGVRNVAAWTNQMMKEHGLTRDEAARVWVAANQLLKRGRQTNVKNVVDFVTGVDPETPAKEMTQKDVAAIQSKAAATAFKAGKKAGAEAVRNEPEKVSLKERINQAAETQIPIQEIRTKAQAIREQIENSISKRDALKEFYKGQERASEKAADDVRKSLVNADRWSAADAEHVRKSLLELVNTLPVAERGKFTTQITAAIKRAPLMSEDNGAIYERAAKVSANIMNRAEEVHRNSIIEDIKETVKKSVSSPSVDIKYKSKIMDAVRRIGLSNLSSTKESFLKGVREYVSRVGEQNSVPDEIIRQIDLLGKTPAKDLPLNVLEAIRDKVNLLEQLGRTITRTREHLYENEKNALMSEIANSKSRAIDDLPERRSPGIKLSLSDRVTQRAGNKIRSVINYATRTGRTLLVRDVMLDMLDGDANYKGALNRIIGGRIDADYNSEMNLREELQKPFKELASQFGHYTYHELERISIFAISKEDNGIARLKDSGVLTDTIKTIQSSMTAKEMAYYKTARNLFDESVLPSLSKFMRENYNVEVKPVENYWPYQRDNTLIEADKTAQPSKVEKGDDVDFDELAAWRQLENDFIPRRTTKAEQGMTIERVPDARGAVKLNAAKVVNRHLNDFAHLISTQRNLRMLGQIVRKEAFAKKYGALGRDYILNLLDTVARNSSPAGSTRTAWMDWLQKNTSVGIIGLRLLSQMKHAPNFALSLKNVRPDFLVKGLVKSLLPEGREFLKKNFSEIAQRNGGEVAIDDLMQGNWARRFQAGTFFLERGLDSLNARSTVLGRYMQEMANRGVDSDEIFTTPVDKEAQRMALLIARQSVTSPLLKDIPQAISRGQLTGNNMSFAHALFQFQTTMLRQAAFAKHDIWDLGLKKLDAKQFTVATLVFMGMLYAESKIIEANKHLLGSNASEKDKETTEHEMAVEAAKRIPFAGNVVSMTEYGETGIPLIDTFVKGIHSSGELLSDKGDFGQKLSPREKAKTKADVSAFVGEMAGVPGAATAAQIYKNKVLPPPKK